MNSLLLSKVISQLLLPPGSLILLGLLGLIIWRRWWGRSLAGVSLALFWLLSTTPIRDMLLEPLESAYAPVSIHVVDAGAPTDTAIVLLGGGVYEKAPEYGDRDQLAGEALSRTWYAAYLATKTGLPVYATGGIALSDAIEAEGEVMRRYLIKLGVPATHVHAETQADNTWGNANLVRSLIEDTDIRQVILVTSARHMLRAVWCFKSQGIPVLPAPCAYIASRSAYDLRSYFPHWGVLRDSSQALHEYLGLIWYGLRYGHGFRPFEIFAKLSLSRPL